MPGIANRTVPRLRAQPGSLLSLLPVRNVKDQPVGGSRREQTHTRTHTSEYTTRSAYTHAEEHRLGETEIHASNGSQRHTPTLRRKHTRAWLTTLSHHEGSSQAKPWGLSRDDSKLPAGSSLHRPGGAPQQSDSWTATLLHGRSTWKYICANRRRAKNARERVFVSSAERQIRNLEEFDLLSSSVHTKTGNRNIDLKRWMS